MHPVHPLIFLLYATLFLHYGCAMVYYKNNSPFLVFTFVYTIVNVMDFLIYPINRGADVLCAPKTARTPIDVSLLRAPTGEHRVPSSHYTPQGVCKRVVQANCPGKSLKVPMFRRKLPPELGE